MNKPNFHLMSLFAKVALKFSNKTIPLKIQRARQIHTALTGNLAFPTPSPALATVKLITDELETAYQNALDGGKSLKAIQRTKNTAFMKGMALLASYVDSASSGDELRINSAGMEVRRPSVKLGMLTPPQGLESASGALDGSVDLNWDKVSGAKSYQVEYTTDPVGSSQWINYGIVTASKATVSNLTSGTKYWFQVSAIGAAGKSNPSDPSDARAK